MVELKQPWQYQRELEAARREAEEGFIKRLYSEAFQRGVERGKFEERMAQHG